MKSLIQAQFDANFEEPYLEEQSNKHLNRFVGKGVLCGRFEEGQREIILECSDGSSYSISIRKSEEDGAKLNFDRLTVGRIHVTISVPNGFCSGKGNITFEAKCEDVILRFICMHEPDNGDDYRSEWTRVVVEDLVEDELIIIGEYLGEDTRDKFLNRYWKVFQQIGFEPDFIKRELDEISNERVVLEYAHWNSDENEDHIFYYVNRPDFVEILQTEYDNMTEEQFKSEYTSEWTSHVVELLQGKGKDVLKRTLKSTL